MFTGLVHGTARVRSITPADEGTRLYIETPLGTELHEGASVAVNGVCLTAIDPNAGGFDADVMAATLRSSSLGMLAAGDRVNLELPVRATDRLGGHIVQGHVDGTGTIASTRTEGIARVVRVECNPALLRYIVERGSIAVDGVSLTVAALDDDGFAVSLIPETLEHTTLGEVELGRLVNLEVDVIAKYVERFLAAHA